MHGAALRLLMDEDQRKIVAEYGYRRSVAYCEQFKRDSEEELRGDSWNKVEKHGKDEIEILEGTRVFLKAKKKKLPHFNQKGDQKGDLKLSPGCNK